MESARLRGGDTGGVGGEGGERDDSKAWAGSEDGGRVSDDPAVAAQERASTNPASHVSLSQRPPSTHESTATGETSLLVDAPRSGHLDKLSQQQQLFEQNPQHQQQFEQQQRNVVESKSYKPRSPFTDDNPLRERLLQYSVKNSSESDFQSVLRQQHKQQQQQHLQQQIQQRQDYLPSPRPLYLSQPSLLKSSGRVSDASLDKHFDICSQFSKSDDKLKSVSTGRVGGTRGSPSDARRGIDTPSPQQSPRFWRYQRQTRVDSSEEVPSGDQQSTSAGKSKNVNLSDKNLEVRTSQENVILSTNSSIQQGLEQHGFQACCDSDTHRPVSEHGRPKQQKRGSSTTNSQCGDDHSSLDEIKVVVSNPEKQKTPPPCEEEAPEENTNSIINSGLHKLSWTNKKKKKKNSKRTEKKSSHSSSAGDPGDLSLSRKKKNSKNSEVDGGGVENGDLEDDASRPPSQGGGGGGSGSGPRRLARRGIGMFPSSNWRRLRNTLKAANEMQGSKKVKHTLTREDSFLRKFSTRNHQQVQNASASTDEDGPRLQTSEHGGEGRFVIQHDGNFMFYWLGVVTVSVLYNLWTCIARQAFREIQDSVPVCWFTLDALFDLIYICDIVVQFRTGYLDQGLMVYDSKKLRQKYLRSRVVFIDFLCLLPLDLLQFQYKIGINPMIRFPRFLKIYRTFRFLHMLESRTAYPNLIRVANLTHILFLGAHWFAAFYYMISEAEGFTGDWAYPKPVGEFADVNRKYLRSLFWSTLTLTTIGDLPPPDNSNEYVFVIVSYLIGVFVFATIVGQVGNVINNRNASRQEFERLLDGAKIYMQTHNVPPNLQKRVQRWYDYVWSRGRLNGCDINSLGLLPDKLKTELAIHVNLETLKKVTIFQECQPEFLHDLVLKMKAYIFTPGDLICRRGEVAREMFIIADGVVEIISETGVMLKRMGAGDFFGEIGILNLDGGINRRSADVRSVGYLELFVLSRDDVLGALKDHPEAESIIRDYGQRRLREVEAHRQKVKPLKCKVTGSVDNQTGQAHQAATANSVQNRLLMTLRSLNPVVRRQSGGIGNHNNNSSVTPATPTSAGNNKPTVTTGLGGIASSPTQLGQRRSSSHEELTFHFDDSAVARARLKDSLHKLSRDSTKSVERQNSGGKLGGRSHAMSIIQQPTSDLTYQQITTQIQTLQNMMDKRLSQLEDLHTITASRLDRLTASQDLLMRALRQQLLTNTVRVNKGQSSASEEALDGDVMSASRV